MASLAEIRSNHDLGFGQRDYWPDFMAACAKGDLPAVQRYAVFSDAFCGPSTDGMLEACEGGHLAVVQWLVAYFGLTAANTAADGISDLAFLNACDGGYMSLAQWLAECFDLLAKANKLGRGALRVACVEGHLALAQWVAKAFDLTSADARESGSSCVLREAAERLAKSSLSAARWAAPPGACQADFPPDHTGVASWLVNFGEYSTTELESLGVSAKLQETLSAPLGPKSAAFGVC